MFFVEDQTDLYDQHTYLTRLFYEKSEVYISLYFSILDKNFDESMFWAYELLRSGFMYELISFFITYHSEFFEEYNPGFITILNEEFIKLHNMIQQTPQTKQTTSEIIHIVGNIIHNFIHRPYSIIPWIKTRYGDVLNFRVESIDYTKKFRGKIDKIDLHDFNTSSFNYSKYSIRKRECIFMKNAFINNKNTYDEWMDNIIHTPYWKHVIRNYGGHIDHHSIVRFPTEKLYDEFIDTFYPDFDTMSSIEKLKYGLIDDEYAPYFRDNIMSWQEFYQKYYYDITQDSRMEDVFESFGTIGM